MPGRAQSMTTTWGWSSLRQLDGFLAVAGLADDFHVGLVFEHAAEATANQAVIIHEQNCDLLCHKIPLSSLGHGQPHQRATFCWREKFNLAAHQLGALAHGHHSDAARLGRSAKSGAGSSTSSSSVLRQETQPHPGLLGAGMPRHVVQCLLQDAVDVNTGAAVDRKWRRPVSHRIWQSRSVVPRWGDTSRACSRVRPRRASRGAAPATGCGHSPAWSARSQDFAQIGPQRRSFGGMVPARRSMEPIAVRIWPNSSCSSREM